MKNQIVAYKTMMRVTMKDGRLLFFSEIKYEALKQALKTDPFVTIEGITVNKFEIKYIEKAPEELDLLIGLDTDVRNQVVTRFEQFKSELGREPNRREQLRIIEKISSKK